MNLSSKEISCADALAGSRTDKRADRHPTDKITSDLHFALYDDNINITIILVHKM